MVNAAEIRIWGEHIAAVVWDEQKQLAFFEFHSDYFKQNHDLAPLSMPKSLGSRVYSFPELKPRQTGLSDTFKGLPGLLADSLPDAYGNQLIELWLARNGRPPNSLNPVKQLCFIGERGMGALEFFPSTMGSKHEDNELELSSMVEIAHRMLQERQDFKSKVDYQQEQAIKAVLQLGTSAGGARPKAVIAFHPEKGKIRSGQLAAALGYEHWLIKLDGVSDAQFGSSSGWGRVEYAYALMAQSCGIAMEPCLLLEENGRAHFMTKRFDRNEQGQKHHIQTWCALQHLDFNHMDAFSYEQLFQAMRSLRLSYPEAEQMFKRMVFNVLAYNCDDHTKNFAFRLKQGGQWTLAPAYDLCFAYDPSNHWVNQQTLSVNGKRKGIGTGDFLAIAAQMNIREPEVHIEAVEMAVQAWPDFAAEAGVSDERLKYIWSFLGKGGR